jgi:prepilin-type N-terminal cleavage/methylation domain-containing protein/prepilin-type processing-associated H-X9-DG protein
MQLLAASPTIQTGIMIAETSGGIGRSQGSANRSALGRTHPSGFTLVEVLVVILIITVLAAIVFTLTRQVSAKARQAGGVAVMRQVGIATAAYIQDKNDSMPGPIRDNGQRPNYAGPTAPTLFSKLAPYLGLEPRNGTTGLPDSLVCPAFRKAFPGWNANGRGDLGGTLGAPGGSGRVYRMNQDLRLSGKRVFGPQDDGQAATQPDTMKYSVVLDGAPRTPISKIVMLSDFHPTIHGNSTNHLFLDFHVESRPNTFTFSASPN